MELATIVEENKKQLPQPTKIEVIARGCDEPLALLYRNKGANGNE